MIRLLPAMLLFAGGPALGDSIVRVTPTASAELVYNDGLDLLFEESDPATPPAGEHADGPDVGPNTMTTDSAGLGAAVELSLAIEAHPFHWLSLQIRPDLFGQIFFDRRGTAVVRLSPPAFLRIALHPTLALLFASEYVANLVPYRSTFTFHRETATTRLVWAPLRALELDLESVERVKRYPDRVTWSFRSHRVGGGVAWSPGTHVRLSGAYALQLNSGADTIGHVDGDVGAATAEGVQHWIDAGVRVGFGDHLVEAAYRLRLARGGDAIAAVDQPLLSPSGIIEEDSDELSLGGFDKHIVELTYDVRIGSRVVGDVYGRYSRKAFRELPATTDPTQRRVDDVWLVGATVSVRLARGFVVDARALYHVNDSNDGEHSFRNLILGIGARWQR